MAARSRHSAAAAGRRIRAALGWLRPPRRLRFTRGGTFFTGGGFAIGLAAISTGDNLLYLLLGAMMGFIAVSGWLSEQVVRGIEVRARPPRAATAGQPARLAYEIRNRKRWIPSYALEVVDPDADARAFVARVPAGESVTARGERVFQLRGVYPLSRLVLATSFPFGLFIKERDVEAAGEVVVWPRRDLAVRDATPAGERARRTGRAARGAVGTRGEYRGLREYRPGDDPRDVHWRSSAKQDQPLVREYERDDAYTSWICLDLRAQPGEGAERAVEVAASLAAEAETRGERFALAAGDSVVPPGMGQPQLARVLDVLARVRFDPHAALPSPPVDRAGCVLVTAGAPDARFGDVYAPATGDV